MTSGRGGDDDSSDFDLEVIDLEPATATTSAESRGGRSPASGSGPRRGPVLVAAAVVIALVVSVVVNREHDSNRKDASTSTTRPDRLHTDFPSSMAFPFRLGVQVLTGGSDQLQVTDTDTGRITYPRVRNLPDGAVTIVAHSGGTVAVRIARRLFWFTMRDLVAHEVSATTAFPATRRGYLWVAKPGSATLVPKPAEPIATDGAALGETRAGLLVQNSQGIVVRPTEDAEGKKSRVLLRAPVTVIGVHPDRVAWVANECGVLRCPVHITEVAANTTSNWLQLAGRPSPVVVAGASSSFSPSGNYLAIVLPDNSITTAENLVVADLRSRQTTTLYVSGSLEQPARPGSDDGTGETIGWTSDSRYLLLAPSGVGRVEVVDPSDPHILSSRTSWGVTTTAAVIATSSAGPIDLPRHGTNQPIDTGGPTRFGTPGLTLVGADASQVDVFDLARSRLKTWAVEGRSVSESGKHSIAKVITGWLVARYNGNDPIIDLFPNGGEVERSLGNGTQVFAAADGRTAWISDPAQSQVQFYDAQTGTLDLPFAVSGTPVAQIDERLVTMSFIEHGVQLDTVDRSGTVRRAAVIDSPTIDVVASGGSRVAYRTEGNLHLIDLNNGRDRLITARGTGGVALSPDGRYLAWIYEVESVYAMRLDDSATVKLGVAADRVLVADDGTVVFTNGDEIRHGRVDRPGSSVVYGLAPDERAVLGLR